ncbi:MAG: hypothetical protein M3516_07185 [Actinomycetota bacterium]|nr:hypothetical protein [Actinomycetota bacterium]
MELFVVRIAGSLLAAAFAWAAIAKLANRRAWTRALEGYGLARSTQAVALWGVPLAEAAIIVVLLAFSARAAAALTVALLASFSLALLRAKEIRGDRLPCGCFGKATDRDYRLMLLRNAGLGVMAAIVLLSGPEEGLLVEAATPGASELAPAALALAGVLLAWWTVSQTMSVWRKKEP